MPGAGPYATPTAAGDPAIVRWGRLGVRAGPPLILMGITWWLSAQPNLKTDLGWIDLVLRKGAHVTEYALLTLLWIRLLRWGRGPAGRGSAGWLDLSRAAWGAAAIVFLWAISDEVHQHFVTGRVGAPRDVGVDLFGIVLAVAVAVRWDGRR